MRYRGADWETGKTSNVVICDVFLFCFLQCITTDVFIYLFVVNIKMNHR